MAEKQKQKPLKLNDDLPASGQVDKNGKELLLRRVVAV